MTIRIRPLDEQQFAALRDDWQRLLHRTPVDKLFMSWAWQYRWWMQWGHKINGRLLLLGAYDADDNLVGIAPLYRTVEKLKSFIRINRVQFIGNHWRVTGTVRTEYTDFIVEPERHGAVMTAFLQYLNDRVEPDELVICDLDADSRTWRFLYDNAAGLNLGIRAADYDDGGAVRLEGTFEDYVRSLGRNTRLRLFNRRAYLREKGAVRIEYADENSLDNAFQVLDTLHRQRWHKPLFKPDNVAFHRNLCRDFLKAGGLRLSFLYVGERIISALYNVRAGDVEYYIQSGFDTEYDPKVSPGVLHLGYAIEQAYRDGLARFDMLIGGGKNTQYKRHFCHDVKPFYTLQIVRSDRLRWLYKLYDCVQALRRKFARDGGAGEAGEGY
jgi:hypothetical protein